MALIKCPECGKEISDKAQACIHCGCPVQEEVHIPTQQFVPKQDAVYENPSVMQRMGQRQQMTVIVLSALSILFPLLFSRQMGFRPLSFVLSALPCAVLILLAVFQPKRKDLLSAAVLTLGAVISFVVPQFFYRETLTIVGLISYVVFFSVIVLFWLSATSVINNTSVPIIATIAYAVFGIISVLISSRYGHYMLTIRLVSVVCDVALYFAGCILICDNMKYRRPKVRASATAGTGSAYPYVQDAPSTGFAVLSFCFPIVGLILFCVWHDTLPQRAKSAGVGGLLGFIIGIVLTVIAYGVIMSSF